MDNIQLATKIKQLCKLKNITVKALLNACNINNVFLYELEKRGKVPSVEKIELIANYLDVSVDYLLGRTDNPQNIYQGNDSSTNISKNLMLKAKDTFLSKEEAEIVGLYRMLDVRDRSKLMSLIFELEDNIKQKV